MAATHIDTVFATRIYRTRLSGAAKRNAALKKAALILARDDMAGRRWSAKHDYTGYTSYASLNDLPLRDPDMADLAAALLPHARHFARALDFDMRGRKLALDSLWVNVMERGGHHAAHIHPHSVISGTYYVSAPRRAAAIAFEDPRHALMMASPARRENARAANRGFIEHAPREGDVLLWESWLRHAVKPHRDPSPRISVSFNYRLD